MSHLSDSYRPDPLDDNAGNTPAFVKVTEIFDNPADLESAKHDLIHSHLATGGTIRVDREELIQDLHPPGSGQHEGFWRRLREWLGDGADQAPGVHAEGVHPGGLLLVATVPEGKAPRAREIMSHHVGHADLM